MQDYITIGIPLGAGAGGGIIIAVLAQIVFQAVRNKRNGNGSVAAGAQVSDLKTVKGLTFKIKTDTGFLIKNDEARAKTLNEIRDYTRDGAKLQEAVLAETRRQTDEIIKQGKN